MLMTGRRRLQLWATSTKDHGSLSQLLGQAAVNKGYFRLSQIGTKPELCKITVSTYENAFQSLPGGLTQFTNTIDGHSCAEHGYIKSDSCRPAWSISVSSRSSGHAIPRSNHRMGGIPHYGTPLRRNLLWSGQELWKSIQH